MKVMKSVNDTLRMPLLHGPSSLGTSEGLFVDFGTDDSVEANAFSSSARQQQISTSLIRLIHREFGHIDWNAATSSSSLVPD